MGKHCFILSFYALIYFLICVPDFTVGGNWTEWSEWSDCSVSCGEGIKKRFRYCNILKKKSKDQGCQNSPDASPVQTETCKVSPCADAHAPSGNWTEWSEWSACSVSCGEGTKQRFRYCNIVKKKKKGRGCQNDPDNPPIQSKVCKLQPCAVDGGWSNWTKWGPCERQDCYRKTMAPVTFRYRMCNNPLPQHGGAMCQGTFLDGSLCMEDTNCKVDGGWGEWSGWACSNNLAKRTRECDSPAPQNSGKPCPGDSVEMYDQNSEPESYENVCDPEHGDNEDNSGDGSSDGGSGDDDNSDDE